VIPIVVSPHAIIRLTQLCPDTRRLTPQGREAHLRHLSLECDLVGASFPNQEHRLVILQSGERLVIAIELVDGTRLVKTILTWAQFQANQQVFLQSGKKARSRVRRKDARSRRK
jgi:hypothetical protein